MPATRLSALDASFLDVETPTAHMHVGWAATFTQPDEGPPCSFDDLRDHIAGRLCRAPRYRQKLASVPFGMHQPSWVDDDDFDPARHIRRADSRDLGEVVDEIMSTPLDRDRPLWEMWIADGLEDGRIGSFAAFASQDSARRAAELTGKLRAKGGSALGRLLPHAPQVIEGTILGTYTP